MPRSNARPSARVCCFASSPAGSGRSRSLAPYARRGRRETTRLQPNDSSRTRRRRPVRATGRARPLASAAPARSPATTDRPAPRRRLDESGCEDSPATTPAAARAHAAAPERCRAHRGSEPLHGHVRASRRYPRALLPACDRWLCRCRPSARSQHRHEPTQAPRGETALPPHRDPRRPQPAGPPSPSSEPSRRSPHATAAPAVRPGAEHPSARRRSPRPALSTPTRPPARRSKDAPSARATTGPHTLHDSQLCCKERPSASIPRHSGRATRPLPAACSSHGRAPGSSR